MIYFCDTTILMSAREKLDELDSFYISNITIDELNSLKESVHKDDNTKFNARKGLHYLEDNKDKYKIIVYREEFAKEFKQFGLTDIPDTRIISCAKQLEGDITFYANDLGCRTLAETMGIHAESFYPIEEEKYPGFKKVNLNDDELAEFYSNYKTNPQNTFDLLENQYLVINDGQDSYKWSNGCYESIRYHSIDTVKMGKIKPKDVYQELVLDSLNHNQITVIRGKAGTGKSLLGLGFLIDQLEHNKIDKIIIFVNLVAAKDCGKMGFLPGDRETKMLDAQIGNFLIGKLGGLEAVYRMIDDGELLLIPMADSRGLDTSDMKAGIYMTEAQNTNRDIMKLFLQRIGDDAICVVEGDDDTQRDMASYEGQNNGLVRLSQVFRGKDFYGEVTLQNCYRGKIAACAEEM